MRHITDDDELYIFYEGKLVCTLNFWHFFIFGFKERRKGSREVRVCFKRYRCDS